ncbi:MAG: hypothetical protein WA960_22235 [Tunicatimonas sp.]
MIVRELSTFCCGRNWILLPVQEELESNELPFTFREDKCGTRKVVKPKFFFSKKLPGNGGTTKKPAQQTSTAKQQIIAFQGQSSTDHRTQSDEATHWMLSLGFSLSEASAYKKRIDAQALRRSLYGLQTNYLGDERPLEEVYEISKECLDKLLKRDKEAI